MNVKNTYWSERYVIWFEQIYSIPIHYVIFYFDIIVDYNEESYWSF